MFKRSSFIVSVNTLSKKPIYRRSINNFSWLDKLYGMHISGFNIRNRVYSYKIRDIGSISNKIYPRIHRIDVSLINRSINRSIKGE